MQQFLKPAARVAWAGVVAAKFFEKLFTSVHYAVAAFDSGFRGETLLALTRGLETRNGRGVWFWFSWYTSIENAPEMGRPHYTSPSLWVTSQSADTRQSGV